MDPGPLGSALTHTVRVESGLTQLGSLADAEAKLQYFGHLMGRANSLKKTLMLGKIEGRKRRRQ